MNKAEYLEKQRKLIEETPDEELIHVQMPSGDVWKHIPFDFSLYAISIGFPFHLIGKLASAKGEAQKELSEEEIAKFGAGMMRIISDVLLTKLVYPKVTLKETEDSITPDQLNQKDWEYFKEYIKTGGQSSQNSFRQRTAGK